MTNWNLGHFVLERTQDYRDLPAFILKEAGSSRRPLSFFEFNEVVLKISHWFRSKFPHGGFKTGLWGENRVEWCALALGVWHAGGTIVPLMHVATDLEVKNIIAAAKLDCLFISPKLHKDGPFDVAQIYSMDFTQSRGAQGHRSLGDLLADLRAVPQAGRQPEPHSKPDDMAVLIFTSGTTGHPKGVVLSHKNIITNILDTLDLLPSFRGDKAVSILPLAHMLELVAGFLIVHIKGTCISYPDSIKPEDIFNEMRAVKANFMAAVPLFFEIIDRTIQERLKTLPGVVKRFLGALMPIVAEAPFLGKIIFKKIHQVFGGEIRFFATGGAKIDPDIIERFRYLGIQVLQGYGLTETSPIISFTTFKDHRYGTVGRPVSSIKLKIDDPNENFEGEICVQGPSVFSGYFENPGATAEVIRDGWFHTGDIGKLDDEGFLYITGRMKDMIVTPNGKNVYPEELEEILKNSTLFNEVSVLGIDTGRGEEVHAVVVPSVRAPREGAAQREALWRELERLSAPLSDYKRIQSMTISNEELPKTATRKIRKHLLREMIKSGKFGGNRGENSAASHTPLDSELEREIWLNEKLQEITKKTEIWKEAHLRHDLGIDSLTFMEVIGILETHWGVHVPDGDFEKILTVDDLLKRLVSGDSASLLQSAHETVVFNYRRNNNFFMNALRIFVHAVMLRPAMKLFFKFNVVNKKILNQHKNFIVTPNHSSHLDLISVLCALPLRLVNRTYAAAADDYFFDKAPKAFFVRLIFNAIPFERRARIDKGFQVCEEILSDGGNLVIFPEGTRSVSGRMSSFKPGVGRLLASRGYVALPAYIQGAHEAFPKGARFPRMAPVSIMIGRPQVFLGEPATNPGYVTVAAKLQKSVEELRDEAQTVKPIRDTRARPPI